MKEIKAYVHASRIADVIAGLKGSTVWGDPNHDEHNLAVYVVKGSLVPLDDAERHYSLELGEEIINEREIVYQGKAYCRSCLGKGYYQKEAAEPMIAASDLFPPALLEAQVFSHI